MNRNPIMSNMADLHQHIVAQSGAASVLYIIMFLISWNMKNMNFDNESLISVDEKPKKKKWCVKTKFKQTKRKKATIIKIHGIMDDVACNVM